jgi:hypothetical protein
MDPLIEAIADFARRYLAERATKKCMEGRH